MLTPKLSHTGLMKTLPRSMKGGQAQKLRAALAKNKSGKGLVNALQVQQRAFLDKLEATGEAGWANDANIKNTSCIVKKATGIRVFGLDGLPVKRMTARRYASNTFPLSTLKELLTKESESLVRHMYKDTTGNVTVGVGHMIPNAAHAKGLHVGLLPFQWHDLKNKKAVTDADVIADFNRVKAAPTGNYLAEYYEQFTKLKVTDAAARALLDNDANQFVDEVRRSSSFPGFDTYPPEAQQAIVDMAFNMGVPKLTTFTEFVKAVKSRDWKTAAAESSRKKIQSDRNTKTASLLLSAAVTDQAANIFFISTSKKTANKRLNVTVKPDGTLMLKEGKAGP